MRKQKRHPFFRPDAVRVNIPMLWHHGIDHDLQPLGTGFDGFCQSLQVAGLCHRRPGFGHAGHDLDFIETGQFQLRLHCHAVIQLELQRQVLHLFAQYGQRHRRALFRSRKDEHSIVRRGLAGQFRTQGDIAGDR